MKDLFRDYNQLSRPSSHGWHDPKTTAFFVIAILLTNISFTLAATDSTTTAEGLRAVESALAQHRDTSSRLEQAEQTASADIADLREKLVVATRELQDKQEEHELLVEQLAGLTREQIATAKVLAEASGRMEQLTAALVRFSREPPEILLLSPNDVASHVHRSIVLRRLLPWLREETKRLSTALARIEEVREQITIQREATDTAQREMEQQRDSLENMIRLRQGTIEKTAAQREAIAQKLNALSSKANDLRQLLANIQQEENLARAAKPAMTEEPIAEARARGHLRLPVSGNIIRRFGERDGDGVISSGVSIAAASSATVVSPRDGRVVFIGPFRGYGQIVIVQHADSCHSLLSGFDKIKIEQGQQVKAGEPLGNMPARTATSRRPEMYFEWRCHGEPADPGLAAGT